MFYLHIFEQIKSLRNSIEIISKQICFKHAREISGQLFSFLNKSSFTWKQLFKLSAISAISGTLWYSMGSASSLVNSNSTSLVRKNLMKKSIILLFSSFSKNSSKNISILPATSNFPPLLFSWIAAIGRLLGYVKGPEVNIGKDGTFTFSVAPFT